MEDDLRAVTSGSGATRCSMLCLAATFAACFIVIAHGQAVATRPELLSGPWELASSHGVDGIFVMISQAVDRLDRQTVKQQTIQIRVYHRKDGQETHQSYVVSREANVDFDGQRLRVAGLTATFDQDAARWTGQWSFDGQTRDVALERPHPAKGVTLNPLCGNWEGLRDATGASPSMRIHLVQSSDGTLAAWMDNVSVLQTHRYGGWMKVVSADPMNVILQNESPNFQVFGRFSGVLSNDGNNITGHWNDRPARQTFRRVP